LTAKAWAQGEISASAARAICEGRPRGHEKAYGEVEETLVGYAADRNWRDLRAVIAHCRRCADALDDREPTDCNGVHLSKVGDRWIVSGDFDDLGGSTVDQAVNANLDTPTPDDLRSLSKRKADALEGVCRFFLDHADLPMKGGEPPHVSVGIPWAAISNGVTTATTPNLYGPSLSPAQLAEILCDCKLGRVIFGPDSQPLDVGREHRTAPHYLRRAIVARDKGCRFPGCDRKPQRCKVHHVVPWDPDGETKIDNCLLLCQFHHGVIHKRRWINTFDGTTYTVWKPGELVGST
jgi:5-methylcytosine-specific restriction protein A